MLFFKDGVRPESIRFFEETIKKHNKVRNIIKISPGYYTIELINGKEYTVLLTNHYTIGLADVYEVTNNYDLDAIVTMSNWNGYTMEAKNYAKNLGIGVFVYKELMGALNNERPENYFSGYDEDGNKIFEGAKY